MVAWRGRGWRYRQISRALEARGMKLSHTGVKGVLEAQDAMRIAAE